MAHWAFCPTLRPIIVPLGPIIVAHQSKAQQRYFRPKRPTKAGPTQQLLLRPTTGLLAFHLAQNMISKPLSRLFPSLVSATACTYDPCTRCTSPRLLQLEPTRQSQSLLLFSHEPTQTYSATACLMHGQLTGLQRHPVAAPGFMQLLYSTWSSPCATLLHVSNGPRPLQHSPLAALFTHATALHRQQQRDSLACPQPSFRNKHLYTVARPLAQAMPLSSSDQSRFLLLNRSLHLCLRCH